MESELPDESGGADVGILAAAGAPNANLDGVGDGIVRNQAGDAAAAAATASGGIPKAEDGSGSESDDDTDGEEEEAAESTATTRWDVFQALQKVTIPGNFCAGGCAGGCADGSSNTPALPTTLGLSIAAVDVSLPITEDQTQQIRAMTWKVDDESYHNVRGIEPGCISIANPAWEAALADLVRTACLRLGVNPTLVRTELDMMLMFQRGSSIDRCCNADEDERVLGTLMIQLPSVYTGGAMRIWDDNDENSNDSDIVQVFDLGSGAKSTAPFSCHYLCHYFDCDYEMEKIKSGTRLMLLYSLHSKSNTSKPSARRRQLGMAPLERALERLPRYDRLFAVPLTKTYDSVSLATKGINALKLTDRRTVETIRAAAKSGWKFKIVHATRTDVEEREGAYGAHYSETVRDRSSTTKLLRVVDETGKESVNDKNWLSKVLSLNSCEGSGKGMTLAHAPTPASKTSNHDGYCSYSDEYSDYGACTDRCNVSTAQPRYTIAEVWGSPKETVEDKSNPYDPRYDWGHHSSETRTKSYSRTFLLVHDQSSEFEINCLSGREAIDQATEQVCITQDLDLLERLLLLVDNKNQFLWGECCTRLLRFISSSFATSNLSKNRQIEYSDMIIRNLGASIEPSAALFGLIQNVVLRLGWSPFRESVSKIMYTGNRKYLTMSGFLVRANFLLKLRSSVSEFERFEVDPATPCLFESCLTDIVKSRNRFPSLKDSETVLFAVEAMVEHHGWTVLVEKVAKQCFDTMLDSPTALYGNIDWTIDLAHFFLKFKAISGAAPLMEHYLQKLASVYVSTLKTNKASGPIDDVRFVDLMRLILQHGNSDVRTAFGLWISSDPNRLPKLLDKLSLESNIDLSLEFFNKCMLWCDVIDQMLEKFPEIPQAVSSNGRIPLHHATADGYVCVENIKLLFEAYPKGASTVDPVTGMYPFMLASASGSSMDAAFELLVADPSLVEGALDSSDGKKRKRSPSMDDKEE